MKVFQNKSLFKKLILIFVLITIVSFCIPKGVSANDNVLLKPITSLFLTLGDGAVQIIHSIILQQNETLLNIDTGNDLAEGIFTVLVAVAIAIIVAVAVVAASGAFVTALAAAGVTIGTMSVGTVLLISIGTGTVAGVFVNSEFLDNNIKLPIYNISPEEIFSNSIPTFDVDFFNPQEGIYETQEVETKPAEYETQYEYERKIEELKDNDGMPDLKDCKITVISGPDKLDNDKKTEIKVLYELSDDNFYEYEEGQGQDSTYYNIIFRWNYTDKQGIEWGYQLSCAQTVGERYAYWNGSKWKVSDPESTKVDLWDDPINEEEGPEQNEVAPAETGEVVSREVPSTAAKLRSTISNWYIILRNIALVALLSVLVYVGIRILISSTSSDKAKYKQMLLDWIVAVCLLFIMQYIMSFSNLLVEKVTDLLSSAEKPKYLTMVPDVKSKVSQAIASENNEKILKQYGIIPEGKSASDLSITLADNGEETESGETYIQWNTNLMGVLRLKAQESKNETLEYTGYMMMFVMLVLFTVYFVFTYLKRVLYMAFLTVIAPLVAMTYPIDKMNDGKAQAFNMWFKEYIFNLLIQPLHLLLYTVLVSSAIDFARTNMIYSLVAIAFMIPAEKLMRKFFGFEKAQTPGMLGGAAGAALAWSGVNRLMGHKPPKPGSHNTKNSGKSEIDDDKSSINFANNFDKEDAVLNFADKNQKENTSIKTSGIEQQKIEQPKIEDDKKIEANKLKENDYKENNPNEGKIFRQNPNDIIPKTKQDYDREYKRKIKDGIRRQQKAQKKYYAMNMKNKMKKAVKNAHPIKAAAKIGAGAIGATAFATAGGIVGLTSGDPSKAFQYATAGAMGGYNMMKGVPESISSTFSGDYTKEQKEAIERARYDSEEEYQRHLKEEYVKDLKQNADVVAKLERKLGREESEKLLESNFMDSYINDGITNMDDIAAAYTMENGLDGSEKMSRQSVKSTVKYAKQIGSDTTHMKQDDRDKWANTISTKLSKNKRAIDNNIDTYKAAIKVIDNIDRLHNIKNK